MMPCSSKDIQVVTAFKETEWGTCSTATQMSLSGTWFACSQPVLSLTMIVLHEEVQPQDAVFVAAKSIFRHSMRHSRRFFTRPRLASEQPHAFPAALDACFGLGQLCYMSPLPTFSDHLQSLSTGTPGGGQTEDAGSRDDTGL